MPTLLKLSCPDRPGLLARLTAFIAFHGGNLLEVNQFTDHTHGWFFARLAVDSDTLALDLAALRKAFAPIGAELEAEWTLRRSEERMKVALCVSKQGHCLHDLLWRWKSGDLPIDIPLVISNHLDYRETVEREGLRFVHVPMDTKEAAGKEEGFRRMDALCREAEVDLIVLARYMQILPEWFCEAWHGRTINIHHSFLPAFVGANPYQRAFDRGVKLIGATCHYVTGDLDEGPIIEQEVARVGHFHSPADLVRLGQDCERVALARGVRYHAQDRVLIHGNKTVVFAD